VAIGLYNVLVWENKRRDVMTFVVGPDIAID
jgi:hypothetical protein